MLTGTCHCGAVTIELARRPRSLTQCTCSILPALRCPLGVLHAEDRAHPFRARRRDCVSLERQSDRVLSLQYLRLRNAL